MGCVLLLVALFGTGHVELERWRGLGGHGGHGGHWDVWRVLMVARDEAHAHLAPG